MEELIKRIYERMVFYAFTAEGGGFTSEKRHLVCKSCHNGATGFDINTIQHDSNCETGKIIVLYKKLVEEK